MNKPELTNLSTFLWNTTQNTYFKALAVDEFKRLLEYVKYLEENKPELTSQ